MMDTIPEGRLIERPQFVADAVGGVFKVEVRPPAGAFEHPRVLIRCDQALIVVTATVDQLHAAAETLVERLADLVEQQRAARVDAEAAQLAEVE